MNLTDIADSISEIPKATLLPGSKPNSQEVLTALQSIAFSPLVKGKIAKSGNYFRYGCYRQLDDIFIILHLVNGKFTKCKLVFSLEGKLKRAELNGEKVQRKLLTLEDVLELMLTL